MDSFDFICAISLLDDQPFVEFSVETSVGLNLAEFPGVSEWLQTTCTTSIKSLLGHPKRVVFFHSKKSEDGSPLLDSKLSQNSDLESDRNLQSNEVVISSKKTEYLSQLPSDFVIQRKVKSRHERGMSPNSFFFC